MRAEPEALGQAAAVLPSDALLQEQAYLVARGVRVLSLIGRCTSDPVVLLRIATKIRRAACPGVVSFVIDHRDETASFGYAGAAWAVDLFEWANGPLVPQEQRHRINGLLLGYGVSAISRHEEESSGRRFREATTSCARRAGEAENSD
jgi:hypothetical protein